MADVTKAVVADLCHAACEVLAEHPEGMHVRDILQAVRDRYPIPERLLKENPKSPRQLRFHYVIGFHTVAEVKAGWLAKDGWGRWNLTERGREALQRYPTAQEFQAEAARLYYQWKHGNDEIKANAKADTADREWPLEDPTKLLAVKSSDRLNPAQRALLELASRHPGQPVTTEDIAQELGKENRYQVVADLHGFEDTLQEIAGTAYWPVEFAKDANGEEAYIMDPRIAAIWNGEQGSQSTLLADGAHRAFAQKGQTEYGASRQHLIEATNTTVEQIAELEELLETKRQLIFEGPPGSGKTYIAEKFARYFTGNLLEGPRDEHVTIVQFHQSYGYEDFIQGIRPQTEAGHLSYVLQDGIFKDLCKKAGKRPDERFVVVIDEINRGNIARIFGELLLLLEYRNEEVRLPYDKPDAPLFTIPPNVYVIGTMNTADRSLAQIDYALRRRFYFYAFLPVVDGEAPYLERWLVAEGIPADVRNLVLGLFIAINKRVADQLGEDFLVGHSYFMNPDVLTEEGRERIWKRAILPLLGEYFHNRQNRPELLKGFSLPTLLTALEASGKPEAAM